MDGRIQREQDFFDKHYANPFVRGNRVNQFYMLNRTIKEQYWRVLVRNGANAKVLEYGCGTGSYAFELAKNGAKVTGIDISQVAIDAATTRAKQEGVDGNTTFELMDAESLSLVDNSFDLVCGTGILHHLQLENAMAEISRVLCAGGKAVFIEPLGHNVFINAFRRLTPEIRSVDERPLLETDLLMLKRYFQKVHIRYFYFSALAAAPFAGLPGFDLLLGLLVSVDRLLFKVRILRRQAWQVLIELSKPIKSQNIPRRTHEDGIPHVS